jgi:hypothetical protein
MREREGGSELAEGYMSFPSLLSFLIPEACRGTACLAGQADLYVGQGHNQKHQHFDTRYECRSRSRVLFQSLELGLSSSLGSKT